MTKSKNKSIPKAIASAMKGLLAPLRPPPIKKKVKKAVARAAALLTTRRVNNDLAAFSQKVSVQTAHAPVSMFSTIRNKSVKPMASLPFEFASLQLSCNAAGNAVWGNAASVIATLELDPNFIVTTQPLFGALGSVAASFGKFRIRDLKMEYLPFCPTSTAGGFTVALLIDPAEPSQASYTFAQVAQCDASVTFPPWQKTIIPVSHYNTDWLFMMDPTTGASSSERLTNAGMIRIANAGGLPTVTTFGVIKLSGILDLTDVRVAVAAPTALAQEERKDDSTSSKVENEPQRLLTAQQFADYTSYRNLPPGLASLGASSIPPTPTGWTSVHH